MAFCINFKLIRMDDTKAIYAYGDCTENFEGLFELDLEKLLSGETPSDTDIREVVKVIKPCISDIEYQHKANRAFIKIYKHYKETSTYLLEGGYYA
ncbi:hypothetical protein G8C92_20810 [Paenibacillus donghaensis]|uniref:Uncharacterized protein n=2 Tax=Paenibacillus TaxID=44249 RepID=A0A919YIU8_9BACL|nr:hypothetical protein [Paenibacillus donghaensis]GIO49440.1 hypothetical protein J34TS1_42050 [Paenibacillus azoreducens]